MKDIEERLLTRFKWGLAAEITRPDYQLRRDILRSKMRRDGITLSDEIVDFIANNVRNSVRDLEGILASLLAHSTLTDKEIDLALAEKVVSHIVALQPRHTSIGDILGAVADHYNIPDDSPEYPLSILPSILSQWSSILSGCEGRTVRPLP